MSDKSFYFKGHVRVYLQGMKALAVHTQSSNYFSYYLGSPRTHIKVRDFRKNTFSAARKAIQGEGVFEFAQDFNQAALAKIRLKKGQVKIDMHEGSADETDPILWLGVVNNGEEMPLTYFDWEIFRPVSATRTGFAMLLPE